MLAFHCSYRKVRTYGILLWAVLSLFAFQMLVARKFGSILELH